MYELGVRAVLRNGDGKILFIKNKRGLLKGKWALPGGKVEKNEYADDGIKREVFEELNLIFEPKFIAYHQDITSDSGKFYLTLFFRGKLSGNISKVSDEISDHNFFTVEEIKKNTKFVFGHKVVALKYI